jgi:hypothetical protein
MKIFLAFQIAVLLIVAAGSQAATVEYTQPNLTIVAKSEPLDTVLKSIGKEMRIYITIPTGLNPVVNCDIQNQPIKQAFKTLLGDMSYSLEWEKGGERLVGLTILAGGNASTAAASSDKSSAGAAAVQSAPVDVAGSGEQAAQAPVAHGGHASQAATHDDGSAARDAAMAEHEARMETERAEREAQMAEERAAQEEKMKEEVARHDAQHEAELKAFLDSKGVQMPQ